MVHVPPGDYGIHRYQQRWVSAGGRRLLTLESVVMRLTQGLDPDQTVNRYRIDFRGYRAGLPMVKAARIISGDMVAPLVRDRYVLIGLTGAAAVPAYATPIAPHGGLSPLEFHGYALRTLTAGRINRSIAPLSAPGPDHRGGLRCAVQDHRLP